jgi:hypothetical protein
MDWGPLEELKALQKEPAAQRALLRAGAKFTQSGVQASTSYNAATVSSANINS